MNVCVYGDAIKGYDVDVARLSNIGSKYLEILMRIHTSQDLRMHILGWCTNADP